MISLRRWFRVLCHAGIMPCEYRTNRARQAIGHRLGGSPAAAAPNLHRPSTCGVITICGVLFAALAAVDARAWQQESDRGAEAATAAKPAPPSAGQSAAGSANGLADDQLAKEAERILSNSCASCHGGEGSSTGYAFDAGNLKSLVTDAILVRGKPDESKLYKVISEGWMPPKRPVPLPRPNSAETETIRLWIERGMPLPPEPEQREFISLADELTAIYEDLRGQPDIKVRDIRYFTLTNLHNDSSISGEDIDVARLALVKLLYSLSWRGGAVKPVHRFIGRNNTLLAVNIRDLEWSDEHWLKIINAYPYGLTYEALQSDESGNALEEQRPDKLVSEIRGRRTDGTHRIVVRGDWFIARASQPPLYYTLLYDLRLKAMDNDPTDRRSITSKANPKGMKDVHLEQTLGLDAIDNIREGRVKRAGFIKSGISGQNRIVERHEQKVGGRGNYYWKSYDFLPTAERSVIVQFPFGPRYKDNRHEARAFEHDGGEILFSLPNGLQGYLLVDKDGNRIDKGPIEIVADSLKTSGNDQIVSGLSCIACHRKGIVETADDQIRNNAFLMNVAMEREYRDEIYPKVEEFNALAEEDKKSFLASLSALLGLPVATLEVMPDPVARTAREYLLEPVTLERAAADLHVTKERLGGIIATNKKLQEYGLKVLVDGVRGGLKRGQWESPSQLSLMQKTAMELDYGTE